MVKTGLREITQDDVKEALIAALAIGEAVGGQYKSTQLGDWMAVLLTRPEKTVYIDVEYKQVPNEGTDEA